MCKKFYVTPGVLLSMLTMAATFAACDPNTTGGTTTPPTPVTNFPCTEHKSIALRCDSDLGFSTYNFDVAVDCNDAGEPIVVYTDQSADSPYDFRLGNTCKMNSSDWLIKSDFSEAAYECLEHWADTSTTLYSFSLSFAAPGDDGKPHGVLYIQSDYTDPNGVKKTPGYLNCTF